MNVSSLQHIISEDEQLLFLHIPKTAGTSLNKIIIQNFCKEERSPFLPPGDMPRISQQTFNEYRYFRTHSWYELMCKLLPKEPICLTMLRDPVERFISSFAFLQQRTPPVRVSFYRERVHRSEILRRITLAEYVNKTEPALAPVIARNENRQTQLLGTRFNFETRDEMLAAIQTFETPDPQLNALKIKSSSLVLIEQAKRRLNRFAFVGLTKRFQDSLYLLAYTFGWKPVVNFQRLNVTPDRPSREEIPLEIMKKIIKFNTLDLELYEYTQQLFETRFTQMTNELLKRYGQRVHAHLKPPLSQGVMQELLEKHYAWAMSSGIRRSGQSILL